MFSKRAIKLVWLDWLFLFIATACAVSDRQVREATSVISPPVVTQIMEQVVTLTPQPVSSWTPLPTLPPAEAQALVVDLLQNNADCRLPCWWGFKPGHTTWEAAWQFLATVATRLEQGESRQFTERGITYYRTNYSVFYEVGDQFGRDVTHYSLENGIITTIQVGSGGTALHYQLHQLLTDYGIPNDVMLRAYASSPESYLPFRLVLSYPQLGILAHYEYEAHKLGDLIQSCPQPVGADLLLWLPEQQTVTFETLEWFAGVSGLPITLQSLEDVTDMNIETFYQIFKDSDNSTCFETPVELWR